ncbi:tol-pal system protein YbgF [Aquicoccus porphyridii]|uniref:Cell division coordinator CpoB n=1 Tax=Aquicoccus porphyridii TaxID=1852029 RepID=A0A5A9ZC21_9RHOB|nr:tol-pal system protein YbgF [Aquicoccus porphyridii]KAA0914656.1 tol-pal system protein YbgF [Aquicoccus porphyridii]RAI53273.1 tol-pal system protein YbgF [Rhodobacteraceae bacterium AsT-22]
MRWGLGLLVAVFLAGTGAAQDRSQTLADIRQDLTVLHVELQKLKRELSTTGASGAVVQGDSVLDRVNTIEAEVRRLTAKTEELEMRIGNIVRDGTNRVADLEFRLVELEGGDVSQLGETTTLGGAQETQGSDAAAPADQSTQDPEGPQLAMGERADFDAAQKALDEGRHDAAADGFARFNETYPGSPLEVAAHLGRGRALEASGNLTEAARSYLAAFSADPDGKDAPDALFELGRGLGRLGQTNEACVTLHEVGTRFPGAAAETKAREEIQRLECQ